MRVYSYDRTTGAYVGTVYADPDQMQPGEFLLPAFSTAIEPPEHVVGKDRVFSVEGNAWSYVDVPVPPTVAPALLGAAGRAQLLRQAVGRLLNGVAISQEFDSIEEAVSYAEEPAVLEYQIKGRALRAWRSRVWFAFDELLPQLESGQVEQPTTDQALFNLLPAFTQQYLDDAAAALSPPTDGE